MNTNYIQTFIEQNGYTYYVIYEFQRLQILFNKAPKIPQEIFTKLEQENGFSKNSLYMKQNGYFDNKFQIEWYKVRKPENFFIPDMYFLNIRFRDDNQYNKDKGILTRLMHHLSDFPTLELYDDDTYILNMPLEDFVKKYNLEMKVGEFEVCNTMNVRDRNTYAEFILCGGQKIKYLYALYKDYIVYESPINKLALIKRQI